MHLCNINRIKHYLDHHALEVMIHAFITSKLDYGNALLNGYPAALIQKLQRVQNSAVGILTNTRKYDHITPVLYKLHWLPVHQRIKFKVALLVFKCIHGTAPSYLQDLITPYVPPRQLRSSDQLLLTVPQTKSNLVRQGALCVAGPQLWNSLPFRLRAMDNINHFKRDLKTFLFKQHYD